MVIAIPQLELALTFGDKKTLIANSLQSLYVRIDQYRKKETEVKEDEVKAEASGLEKKAEEDVKTIIKLEQEEIEKEIIPIIESILKVEEQIDKEVKERLIQAIKAVHQELLSIERMPSEKEEAEKLKSFDQSIKLFASALQKLESDTEKEETVLAGELDDLANRRTSAREHSARGENQIKAEIAGNLDKLNKEIPAFEADLASLQQCMNNLVHIETQLHELDKPKQVQEGQPQQDTTAARDQLNRQLEQEIARFTQIFEPTLASLKAVTSCFVQIVNYGVIYIFFVIEMDENDMENIFRSLKEKGFSDSKLNELRKEEDKFINKIRQDARILSRGVIVIRRMSLRIRDLLKF